MTTLGVIGGLAIAFSLGYHSATRHEHPGVHRAAIIGAWLVVAAIAHHTIP